MPGFWVRFLITACGLLLAAWLLEGVHFGGVLSLLFAALVLGVVNAMGTHDRGRRVLVHDLLLLGHYHHVGRELDADRTDPPQPDLRYGRDLATDSPRAEVSVYG